ncbi:MAG TPA: hypothetical protein VHY79_03805 [Rhizomicrobium sp.]|jgi:hypothetical protein|nr:hypothetical protein [Rhizomicrobium sp.]
MNIEPGHHVEPRGIGHKWFDVGITIAILLISVSSLVVAIVHSQTLERMADANSRLVEANSWPFLSYNTANGRNISMSIVNDGVGPAKIETVEVKWHGRAHRDAVDFLQECCGFRPGTADIEFELIAGRVLRAGQSLNIVTVPHTLADEPAWSALNRARISPELSVDVCYCSVFDQCWTEDIVRFSLKPREVERCLAAAIPYGIPR